MDFEPDSSQPLYLQIRDSLQQQIESGIYTDGARLPSERDLAESFGVSRMTARQAVQMLIQDGLLSTRVGKGTFVQRPRLNPELRELTSFTDDMQRAGARPSSRVVLATVGPADSDIAGHLDLEVGCEVVKLHRLRLADGEVIALERAHIDHSRCPGLLDGHDFARHSLYQVLKEKYGIHLMWASEIISARMPDREERSLLELGYNVPVLSMKRVTYNERNEAIEYVRSCYHSERYQMRTVLRDNNRSTAHGG